MAITLMPYDREAAVAYAHLWAFQRNPVYYNYDEIGGDCTNFASQCLYAGSRVMNFTPTFGWYYINANEKSPSWTGVEFFYNFLTREEQTIGPAAEVVGLETIKPGDMVQLSFNGESFAHTPVIVGLREPVRSLNDVLVAAHSVDSDDRPLSTYQFKKLRFLHIKGVYRPTML